MTESELRDAAHHIKWLLTPGNTRLREITSGIPPEAGLGLWNPGMAEIAGQFLAAMNSSVPGAVEYSEPGIKLVLFPLVKND